MKNTECIICGDEVINPLQKQQGKRMYCSEKCEYIPSVFQRWVEFQVWLNSNLVAADLSVIEVLIKNYPIFQNQALDIIPSFFFGVSNQLNPLDWLQAEVRYKAS